MRNLIGRGALINKKNDQGATAIMGSTQFGHLEVTQLLIDAGANIEDHNDKSNPLINACKIGSIDIVKLLIFSDKFQKFNLNLPIIYIFRKTK